MVVAAILALVSILIIASVIDMIWGEVPNIITMLLVLVPSFIVFIQVTDELPLLYKTHFLICIIVMYLGIMWAGEILVTQGKIGGADIKILGSMAPALVAMGYVGALYLFWFFVINPFANMLYKNKLQGAFKQRKIRFVPIMTIVFVILVLVRFF